MFILAHRLQEATIRLTVQHVSISLFTVYTQQSVQANMELRSAVSAFLWVHEYPFLCVLLFLHIKQSYSSLSVPSRGQVERRRDENRRANVRTGWGEGRVGHGVIWFRAGSNQDWQFPVFKKREDRCIMHEWPVVYESCCFTLHWVLLLLLCYTATQTQDIFSTFVPLFAAESPACDVLHSDAHSFT